LIDRKNIEKNSEYITIELLQYNTIEFILFLFYCVAQKK